DVGWGVQHGSVSLPSAACPPGTRAARVAQWCTMQQLQFVELDEGGHLVVSAADGTRYAVPVDDRLRSALRPRPRPDPSGRPGSPSASPRDVQSLIRAGQTAEEVATLTGWELDRVRRFEGPVLAEREHV